MYDHDLDLEDLLADPLVRLLMASDGVDEAQIRTLAHRIAPRPPAVRALQARMREASSALRHTPSCRGGWRGPASVQPSV